MHVVGDHQAGDLFFCHDALGQLQHLLRRGRVQGCGVLVQQQELGGNEGGHEQGQRLPPDKRPTGCFIRSSRPMFSRASFSRNSSLSLREMREKMAWGAVPARR